MKLLLKIGLLVALCCLMPVWASKTKKISEKGMKEGSKHFNKHFKNKHSSHLWKKNFNSGKKHSDFSSVRLYSNQPLNQVYEKGQWYQPKITSQGVIEKVPTYATYSDLPMRGFEGEVLYPEINIQEEKEAVPYQPQSMFGGPEIQELPSNEPKSMENESEDNGWVRNSITGELESVPQLQIESADVETPSESVIKEDTGRSWLPSLWGKKNVQSGTQPSEFASNEQRRQNAITEEMNNESGLKKKTHRGKKQKTVKGPSKGRHYSTLGFFDRASKLNPEYKKGMSSNQQKANFSTNTLGRKTHHTHHAHGTSRSKMKKSDFRTYSTSKEQKIVDGDGFTSLVTIESPELTIENRVYGHGSEYIIPIKYYVLNNFGEKTEVTQVILYKIEAKNINTSDPQLACTDSFGTHKIFFDNNTKKVHSVSTDRDDYQLRLLQDELASFKSKFGVENASFYDVMIVFAKYRKKGVANIEKLNKEIEQAKNIFDEKLNKLNIDIKKKFEIKTALNKKIVEQLDPLKKEAGK